MTGEATPEGCENYEVVHTKRALVEPSQGRSLKCKDCRTWEHWRTSGKEPEERDKYLEEHWKRLDTDKTGNARAEWLVTDFEPYLERKHDSGKLQPYYGDNVLTSGSSASTRMECILGWWCELSKYNNVYDEPAQPHMIDKLSNYLDVSGEDEEQGIVLPDDGRPRPPGCGKLIGERKSSVARSQQLGSSQTHHADQLRDMFGSSARVLTASVVAGVKPQELAATERPKVQPIDKPEGYQAIGGSWHVCTYVCPECFAPWGPECLALAPVCTYACWPGWEVRGSAGNKSNSCRRWCGSSAEIAENGNRHFGRIVI